MEFINSILKERVFNKNYKYIDKTRYNIGVFLKRINKSKTECYYIQNYNGHYFLDKTVSILFKGWM